jgi:hypothetical protein
VTKRPPWEWEARELVKRAGSWQCVTDALRFDTSESPWRSPVLVARPFLLRRAKRLKLACLPHYLPQPRAMSRVSAFAQHDPAHRTARHALDAASSSAFPARPPRGRHTAPVPGAFSQRALVDLAVDQQGLLRGGNSPRSRSLSPGSLQLSFRSTRRYRDKAGDMPSKGMTFCTKALFPPARPHFSFVGRSVLVGFSCRRRSAAKLGRLNEKPHLTCQDSINAACGLGP